MYWHKLPKSAALQQYALLKQRLSEPSPRELEEQEYLSEVIELEMDPEDQRAKGRKPRKS